MVKRTNTGSRLSTMFLSKMLRARQKCGERRSGAWAFLQHAARRVGVLVCGQEGGCLGLARRVGVLVWEGGCLGLPETNADSAELDSEQNMLLTEDASCGTDL